MKRILLFVVSLLIAATVFAQALEKNSIQSLDQSAMIERGSRAAADWGTFTNFTATDMNGVTHNIQNYLDHGKYVVIDFFCAWCGPCWSLHTSGKLEQLYNTYGQGGTGEFVVLMIETETSNTAAQITGTHVSNSYSGASQGDFTDHGTNPIPIVDATSNLASKVSLYEGYVPSVYMFCPSGRVCDVQAAVKQGPAAVYSLAGTCPEEEDAPLVDIVSDDRVIVGESIRISSVVTSLSNVISYQWSFGDGTPSLATSTYANVTWNTLGPRTVTLTVTNEHGSTTATKVIDVYDCSTASIEFPFTENFENGVGCWDFRSMNTSNNDAFGVLEYDDGMNGAVFNSYNSASNYNQYMISPRLDHIGELALSFRYKRLSDSGTETFYVKYSTTDNQTSSFVALGSQISVGSSAGTNWQTYNGTLPANAKYFMINYNSNYQYYLVVDNINITETIPNYTVTAVADDAEHGTVTGAGSYALLSEVTLTATPADGFIFEKWNDNDATNPRTITVVSDTAFTALFVETASATSYTVTLNHDENGNVIGGGDFVEGASVQIEAIPNTGYHFVSWSDNDTVNPRTIIVDSDINLTAIFEINSYNISVVSANTNQGTVSGSNTYNYNDVAEISATPAEHYHFLYWSDGNDENPRSITVTEDLSLTAYFTIDQYTVTVNSDNASQGTASGSGPYIYNSNAIVYAIANPGFAFTEWQDHNTDNPRTIHVESDTALTASFGEAYLLTVASSDLSMGRVTGGGYYLPGSEVQIRATANSHYHFVSWNDSVTTATRTITMGDEDVTYTATFAPDRYTITVVSANVDFGTVTGGGEYEYLEEVEISATPNNGYLFVKWSDNNTEATRTVVVTANKTYRANFAVDPDYDNAVDENMLNSIAVYPNPTTGIVNIEAEGLAKVVVFDVTGREIKALGAQSTIDISDLEAGVYFFSIETANGTAMKKLVKE